MYSTYTYCMFVDGAVWMDTTMCHCGVYEMGKLIAFDALDLRFRSDVRWVVHGLLARWIRDRDAGRTLWLLGIRRSVAAESIANDEYRHNIMWSGALLQQLLPTSFHSTPRPNSSGRDFSPTKHASSCRPAWSTRGCSNNDTSLARRCRTSLENGSSPPYHS